MEIFIDSADVNEIKNLMETGLVDGVTTNPSLIAKENKDFKEIIKQITQIVPGPVSAEILKLDTENMLIEAKKLAQISDNVVIKIPLTSEGLKACKILSSEGIKTNVTLCFSANQALLAAKAGATYISPFVGRLDDISMDGLQLIRDIKSIFNNYSNLNTKILAASLRTPIHILEVTKIGVDVSTISPSLFKQIIKHPLTDIGLEKFLEDCEKANVKI